MVKNRLTVIVLCFVLGSILLSGCVENTAQNQTYEKTIAIARTEIWKEISGRVAASATAPLSRLTGEPPPKI
jgi:ABC-type uncharacterized transport system auxiliary subunit